MPTTRITRIFRAQPDEVFATISDLSAYAKVMPHVESYEFLTEQTSGVGTRFREVRVNGKTKMTFEQEVTEFEPGSHVRMECDSHGTIWDTTMRVRPKDGATEFDLTMDARAYKFFPKIMNRLMGGLIKKSVEKDIDCLQAYLEA